MESARPATTSDVPALVEFARSLRDEWRGMRGGALWAVREAAHEPLADAFGALLAREDACIVVGTIDGVVVGYGTAEVELLRDGTRLGIISELFVEQGARAVGVGEAVADELVAFCRNQNCLGVDARALPGHREAKNFFERAGFTARALIMHKPL
jgi:GNAT superfamily N-acetyltransferase